MIGLIAVGVMTLTLVACAPEADDADSSPRPSPSSTASPAPIPSIAPDVPISENSGTPWTYQAAKDLCVNWVVTRSPQNENEVWDFATPTPAQRYGDAWHFQFPGTFTSPGVGETQGVIACAVAGTPSDYTVGEAPSVGDTPPEALLYP